MTDCAYCLLPLGEAVGEAVDKAVDNAVVGEVGKVVGEAKKPLMQLSCGHTFHTNCIFDDIMLTCGGRIAPATCITCGEWLSSEEPADDKMVEDVKTSLDLFYKNPKSKQILDKMRADFSNLNVVKAAFRARLATEIDIVDTIIAVPKREIEQALSTRQTIVENSGEFKKYKRSIQTTKSAVTRMQRAHNLSRMDIVELFGHDAHFIDSFDHAFRRTISGCRHNETANN